MANLTDYGSGNLGKVKECKIREKFRVNEYGRERGNMGIRGGKFLGENLKTCGVTKKVFSINRQLGRVGSWVLGN